MYYEKNSIHIIIDIRNNVNPSSRIKMGNQS